MLNRIRKYFSHRAFRYYNATFIVAIIAAACGLNILCINLLSVTCYGLIFDGGVLIKITNGYNLTRKQKEILRKESQQKSER